MWALLFYSFCGAYYKAAVGNAVEWAVASALPSQAEGGAEESEACDTLFTPDRGGRGSGLASDLDDAAGARGSMPAVHPRSLRFPPPNGAKHGTGREVFTVAKPGSSQGLQRSAAFPFALSPPPQPPRSAGASSALAQHPAAEAQRCLQGFLRQGVMLAGCCSARSGRAVLGSGVWPRPCSWSSNRGKASSSCSELSELLSFTHQFTI